MAQPDRLSHNNLEDWNNRDDKARDAEIPGYPNPTNVESLGLNWCGSSVSLQRRAIALQAAGAWCAISGGTSSSPEQVSARHQDINAAVRRARCARRSRGATLSMPDRLQAVNRQTAESRGEEGGSDKAALR